MIPDCEFGDSNKGSVGRKTENEKNITPSFLIDTYRQKKWKRRRHSEKPQLRFMISPFTNHTHKQFVVWYRMSGNSLPGLQPINSSVCHCEEKMRSLIQEGITIDLKIDRIGLGANQFLVALNHTHIYCGVSFQSPLKEINILSTDRMRNEPNVRAWC